MKCSLRLDNVQNSLSLFSMTIVNTLKIEPPLFNSASVWASDKGQLKELYECAYTGAVTTRTTTLDGFNENETHNVKRGC